MANPPQPVNITPEFIRLPRPGTLCPRTGLSRTKMYQLCNQGLVRSIVLRERGKVRGCRLINYDSLMGYLRSLESQASSAQTVAE